MHGLHGMLVLLFLPEMLAVFQILRSRSRYYKVIHPAALVVHLVVSYFGLGPPIADLYEHFDKKYACTRAIIFFQMQNIEPMFRYSIHYFYSGPHFIKRLPCFL